MPSVKAAVAITPHSPLVLMDLDLAEPEGEEILVRTVASGICHTDLLLRDGLFGPKLPAVPGHEGAGIVEAVGAAVHDVKVGDHVLLTQASCGWCRSCRLAKPMNCGRYAELNTTGVRGNGSSSFAQPVAGNFVGQSSFASYMLAHRNSAVVLPDDLSMTMAAPLGCGITTGASTVFNVMRPAPGSSILIIGGGAVGLAAVMAAGVAGCSTIVVVDLHASRLELARELGATHVLDGSDPDLVSRLKAACLDGFDFGIDAVGLPETLQLTVEAVHPGGHVVLLGANGAGRTVSLDIVTLLFNRKVQGAILGDQIPQITIPEIIALNRQGRFPYERLIKLYPFDRINEAIADAESGRVIKPVLTFAD